LDEAINTLEEVLLFCPPSASSSNPGKWKAPNRLQE
jgi:hypothetical protein